MKNKDLSSWLVVSDIDGTLNTKLRTLPKRNLNAITKFVKECSGHFTLASGRNPESLRKHYEKLPIKGTPAVVINGAGIYDYEKEKMISFTPICPKGEETAVKLMKLFPWTEVEIITDREIYRYHSRVVLPITTKINRLPYSDYKNTEDIPRGNWGKVVFYGFPWTISRLKKYALSIHNPKINFMSSSISSFELLQEGVHKGTAVMKIAEMFNIDYEHTAAIGDYFNDYDMLKTVYLSACCGQAPKELKKITKYHACHCNKGAVGDLLEFIMENNKED